MPEKIPATNARQGQRGQRVFAILAVGLILAGVIWVALEFWGEAIDTGAVDESGVSSDQPAAQ